MIVMGKRPTAEERRNAGLVAAGAFLSGLAALVTVLLEVCRAL